MVEAVWFDQFGLEHLTLTRHSPAALGPGDVRLQVRAVSLNYRDVLMVRGQYNPRLKLPLIPCSDGAGVITEVGAEVEDLAVGDQVCTTMIPDWDSGAPKAGVLQTTLGGPRHGLLCRSAVLPRRAVLKVSEKLSHAEAACLPVAGLTAWSALVTEAKTKAGHRVLLLGTGGVSIMALAIAKRLGAEVIITSGSDEKLARARELGADHGINYRTHPQWAKTLLDRFPDGVDTVLEVGGDGTFDQSVRVTRPGGMVALIGVLAAAQKAVNLTAVLMKRIRVQGILVGSRSEFHEYLAFVEQHGLKPCIGSRFQGLAEAPAAFEHMALGRHFGKIVIEILP